MNGEAVQAALARIVEAKGASGVALAAGRAGELLFEAALGSASSEAGEALSPSSFFDLGSMTQSLATSVIFMGLAPEKRINLNTPAAVLWPEFAEEGKEKVSPRHLLKHTSGLPADRPYWKELLDKQPDWMGTARGKDFILALAAAEGLEYPPTYRLVPSQVGYLALGHLAELIGGAPLPSLFDRIVANPLGLSAASFGAPPAGSAASLVCPHRKKLLRGEVFDLNAWAMGGVAGHAGLFATPLAAVRIGMALARALKGGEGWLPTAAVADFIGPKAKYKMGWEMPAWTDPATGAHFSRNTIGHLATTGASLWIDLEEEFAAAIFAASLDGTGGGKGFFGALPAIHDALRGEG